MTMERIRANHGVYALHIQTGIFKHVQITSVHGQKGKKNEAIVLHTHSNGNGCYVRIVIQYQNNVQYIVCHYVMHSGV